MKTFALIGYPLGHSMSPVIHKELMKAAKIEGSYELIEISPEKLADRFEDLKKFDGFNVTIPHKINIIPFLDKVNERAELFGAVNTVKVDEETTGYNTDCFGFLRALEMADIKLEGSTLVCGAGGVARMFAFECALADCNLTIAVRDDDIEAGNKIKDEIKEKLGKDAKVIKLSEVSDGYDLIINGTPLGMYPNVNSCVLGEEIIAKSKAVFDAVYNPEETLFIKYAKKAGLKYSNGLPMLVWQAAVSEEIWFDADFTFEDIKRVIEITKKEMKKKMNIALCGFMGCGKTCIGKELAKATGKKLVDTDELIEKEQGITISQIFAENGENYFRDLEFEMCKKVAGMKNAVISTGGGAMTFQRNADAIKKGSVVVFIDTDFEIICKRVGDGATRPLFKNRENAKRLYDERKEKYIAAADITVNGNERPAKIVSEIIKQCSNIKY